MQKFIALWALNLAKEKLTEKLDRLCYHLSQNFTSFFSNHGCLQTIIVWILY